MKVHNPFTAIAIDPVHRMIRVHAKSLKHAHHHLHVCCSPLPECPPTDVGQCRIIVNALRREIDRLLRGIDRFDRYIPVTLQTSGASGHRDEGNSEMSQLAGSHQRRKLYAPAPLGQPLAPVALPGTQISGATIISAPRITNLGTQLDVLI